MENQIVTVADLVGAIIAEMERRNYKPSVIKQYCIVWDKLCAYSGAMPVGAFSIEHGMDFLEDVLHFRSHPLSEATSYRCLKAIYLLSDFKLTGVLTLRKPGRESGAAADPFRAYVASMAAKGMSSAHIRNSSAYLERLAAFLDHALVEPLVDRRLVPRSGQVSFANCPPPATLAAGRLLPPHEHPRMPVRAPLVGVLAIPCSPCI